MNTHTEFSLPTTERRYRAAVARDADVAVLREAADNYIAALENALHGAAA